MMAKPGPGNELTSAVSPIDVIRLSIALIWLIAFVNTATLNEFRVGLSFSACLSVFHLESTNWVGTSNETHVSPTYLLSPD